MRSYSKMEFKFSKSSFKWRHEWLDCLRGSGEGFHGFCDNRTEALVLNGVTMGEGCQKWSKILWRHLKRTLRKFEFHLWKTIVIFRLNRESYSICQIKFMVGQQCEADVNKTELVLTEVDVVGLIVNDSMFFEINGEPTLLVHCL